MGTCMFLDFIQSSIHMACVLAEILTVIIYAALKLICNSTCLLINVGNNRIDDRTYNSVINGKIVVKHINFLL